MHIQVGGNGCIREFLYASLVHHSPPQIAWICISPSLLERKHLSNLSATCNVYFAQVQIEHYCVIVLAMGWVCGYSAFASTHCKGHEINSSLPVSSAVQTTKVLREPIKTTEKWRWKNFSALHANGSLPNAFGHRYKTRNMSVYMLRQSLYHYKIVSYGPACMLCTHFNIPRSLPAGRDVWAGSKVGGIAC